eukprot:4111741-Pyramimonas_sp.AAC.1
MAKLRVEFLRNLEEPRGSPTLRTWGRESRRVASSGLPPLLSGLLFIPRVSFDASTRIGDSADSAVQTFRSICD